MRQTAMRFGLFLLLISATLARAVEFKRQTITVSSHPGWWLMLHLQDIDNDGLTDLLALDGQQRDLRVYRQDKAGFAEVPDQTIALEQDTAWIGLHDIDPHPGNELLLSTTAGIIFFRQHQGVFESSSQTLIKARQVFATAYPGLMANLSEWGGANSVVPITATDRTVLYQRDSSGGWRPARTFDLKAMHTTWRTYQGRDWAIESSPSRSMTVRTLFRAAPETRQIPEGQNRDTETRRLIEQLQRDAEWSHQRLQHQDINGDGREDLILWRSSGDLNPKTIVLIFLRGQDGQLSAKPTHVVRGRGLPIRISRERGVTPLWDLDGDGQCELILAALKTRLTSWRSLVDVFLSGGVDWAFTVRSGQNNDYSGGSDFQMDVTSGLPYQSAFARLFLMNGDFNGDERGDILVERSPDQFDVYLSSTVTGFFREGPALTFKVPTVARRVETTDLNGDNISDLFVQAREQAQVIVFLSQSETLKGVQR